MSAPPNLRPAEFPRLLVDWEPPWRSFASSLRAALGKAPKSTTKPYLPVRGLAFSLVAHLVVASLMLWLPLPHATGRAKGVAELLKQHAVYYHADSLPSVTDASGAAAGWAGRSGGNQAHRPAPAVRLARGDKMRPQIVEAPTLRLPKTESPADLIGFSSPAPAIPAAAAQANKRILPAAPQLEIVQPPTEVARLRLPSTPDQHPIAPPPPIQVEVADQAVRRPGRIAAPEAIQVPPSLVLSVNAKLRLPVAASLPAMPTTAVSRSGLRGEAVAQPQIIGPTPSARRAGLSGGFGALAELGSAAVSVAENSDAKSGAGSVNGAGAGGDAPLAAVVLSTSPGSEFGAPSGGGSGSLSASPHGRRTEGIGTGNGAGSGIAAGAGSGSARSGKGPGGAESGSGRGESRAAVTGISPGKGRGGAGTDAAQPGTGIHIEGATVNIPSFGSGAIEEPSGRPRTGTRKSPSVTIVGTGRSGGGLAVHETFGSARVYTVYFPTARGTAVLQFAAESEMTAFGQELTAPEPINTPLPAEVTISRLIVRFVIDRVGAVRELRILDNATPLVASRLVAALGKWRFRPALRGEDAIEVNAILGLGKTLE